MKKGEKFDYDVIVIGSGSAGFSAAESAHDAGASVLMIEAGSMGGECPNFACIPTKALLRCAKFYNQVKHESENFGVHASKVTFSFREIMERKNLVVETITGQGQRLLRLAQELKIDVIRGLAQFQDNHTVVVNNKVFRGQAFVLATGSTDLVPPIDGLVASGFLTYKDAVSMKRLPESLAILGGGPVGCELATFFALLGTKVSIIELGTGILPREDSEVAALAMRQLMKIGVHIFTKTETVKVANRGFRKKLTLSVSGKEQLLIVDSLILAIGKRPNIDRLKLGNTGIKIDEHGRFAVDASMQTSVSHIYAAGDVAGGYLFTHTAHLEGQTAGYNAAKLKFKNQLRCDEAVVPRVTFLDPEIASVGLTPEQAKKSGLTIKVSNFPIGALGRAISDGHRDGLIKIVIDAKTRQILGGHIIGHNAGELIHEIALAMKAGLTIDVLGEMIHAFPTYSEGVAAAASI